MLSLNPSILNYVNDIEADLAINSLKSAPISFHQVQHSAVDPKFFYAFSFLKMEKKILESIYCFYKGAYWPSKSLHDLGGKIIININKAKIKYPQMSQTKKRSG